MKQVLPKSPSRSVHRRHRAVWPRCAVLGVTALVGLMAMLPSCDRSTRDKQAVASGGGATTIVVSGDTGGWIVPCGCAANQSGGLMRRGSIVKQLQGDAGGAREVLYLDAGGAAGGASPYHATKLEAILKGEKLMGVAAHNLGRSELQQGPTWLRDAAARLEVPFVSANARPVDPAQPALAPAVRFATVGGRRIAIVGVVSPKYATREIAVDDPAQAVAAVVAANGGAFDEVIVLAYMPEDELQQLAAAVPEATAVIGGPTGQAIVPKQAGPVLVGAATNKGKFLVCLDRHEEGAEASAGWTGRVQEVAATIADDAAQLQNLQLYLAELDARDFTAAESGLVQNLPAHVPLDYHVAGSQSCVSCHASAHASWLASKHAHAWETLTDKGFHVDPYCQSCHTTGYGLPGGFSSRRESPTMTAVGCESCHGPSQAHVRQPTVRTTFNAFDQCIRCHDQENSPHFEPASYWAKIRHGHDTGIHPATMRAAMKLGSEPVPTQRSEAKQP